MKEFRSKLDGIDKKIVSLLAQRNAVSKKIRKYKKENKIPVFQRGREAEVLKTRAVLGKKLGLNPAFVNKVFKIVLSESRKIQK